MEGKNILIIGKRSNLSNQLQKYIKESYLIQTNDLGKLEEILKVKRKIVIMKVSIVKVTMKLSIVVMMLMVII